MVVEVGRCVKLRCHCSAGRRDKREGRGLTHDLSQEFLVLIKCTGVTSKERKG